MAGCSQSTIYLKLTMPSVVLAIGSLGVAFGTKNWSTLDVDTVIPVSGTPVSVFVSFSIGFWRYCICATISGVETCSCGNVGDTADWFDATRALTAVACFGSSVGCVLVAVALCKPLKLLKLLALGTLIGSGVILSSALILYCVESQNDFDEVAAGLNYISDVEEVSSLTKFGFSFILAGVAAGIILVISTPLLVFDIVKAPSRGQLTILPVQTGKSEQSVFAPPKSTRQGYNGRLKHAPNTLQHPNAVPSNIGRNRPPRSNRGRQPTKR